MSLSWLLCWLKTIQPILYCNVVFKEGGNPPRPTPFQNNHKAGPLAVNTPFLLLIYMPFPFHQAIRHPRLVNVPILITSLVIMLTKLLDI